MTTMATNHFYTGIPDSKVATLPSCPKKGKEPAAKIRQSQKTVNRFIWGGYTVEVKYKKK